MPEAAKEEVAAAPRLAFDRLKPTHQRSKGAADRSVWDRTSLRAGPPGFSVRPAGVRASAMGNAKARDFTKRQELDLAWKRAECGVRELTKDVSIPGIGGRRVQLVCAPSFEPGNSWDVRESNSEYRVFCSRIHPESNGHMLSGYQELQPDVAALRHFLGQLRAMALPIAPDFSGMGGLDGTLYQLVYRGDMSSEIRFQWWSEGPVHWHPLVALADEMMNNFRHLPPRARERII